MLTGPSTTNAPYRRTLRPTENCHRLKSGNVITYSGTTDLVVVVKPSKHAQMARLSLDGMAQYRIPTKSRAKFLRLVWRTGHASIFPAVINGTITFERGAGCRTRGPGSRC